MKKVLFSVVLISTFLILNMASYAALKVDMAISTHANWWSQAAADAEMAKLVDKIKGKLNDVQVFPQNKQAELADWVQKHTKNKQLDILLLCGQFPSTIYKPGNAQPDGSIAELFLEDGNMILNTGDYMFYVVDGAGTNAAGGLQNMMDIPGITMWDDNTPVNVTEAGKKYLPSLKDFQTDRPFHLNELTKEWVTEVIFAGSETRADPVIVKNTSYNGRLGIFYQTAGQDADPRAQVISEFIINWLPTIVKSVTVEEQGKIAGLWGRIKQE